jgi:hypothetical protein
LTVGQNVRLSISNLRFETQLSRDSEENGVLKLNKNDFSHDSEKVKAYNECIVWLSVVVICNFVKKPTVEV